MREILQEQNYEVFGISRNLLETYGDNALLRKSFYIREVFDLHYCTQLLNRIQPQIIFHLASVHGSSTSNINSNPGYYREMLDCHLTITKNVASWQLKSNSFSHLFIALTSQMYKATSSPTAISETSLVNPVNNYAETKLKTWRFVQDFRSRHSINISCGILFNHSSTYSKAGYLFPLLAEQIALATQRRNSSISLKDGLTPVSFSSAKNICVAILAMTLRSSSDDFILGNSNTIQPLNLVSHVLESFNVDAKQISYSSIISSPQNYLEPSAEKAERFLSWNSRENPVDILREMVEFKLNSNL